VERDASSPSPDSSEPSVVTQYEQQVQEEKETEDVIEDSEPEGQVQDSIAAHKPKRNIQKPTRFSDMVVAYALLMKVVEDSVSCSFREAELALSLNYGEMLCWKRLSLFMSTTLGNLLSCPQGRRSLDANEFLQRIDLQVVMCVSKPNW